MRMFLLTALVLVTGSINAQNSLTVFSENGDPFYLILNGVRQNENPETNVQVTGLMQEAYSTKVIFENEDIPPIEKKFLAASGMDCAMPCNASYRIRLTKKGDLRMMPFNFTPMAMAPVPPPNTTVISFNTTPMPPIGTTVQVTETTTTTTTAGSTGTGGVNVGVQAGGPGFGMNVSINDPTATQTHHQQTTTVTTTTTTSGMPTAQPVVVNDCRMGPGEFSQAMGSIRSKTWDESRLEIATQIARNNCLTAAQIRDIMQVMEWEETRLDFAKRAYANCADQGNYFMVNDAFEWESSIEELNSAIGY